MFFTKKTQTTNDKNAVKLHLQLIATKFTVKFTQELMSETRKVLLPTPEHTGALLRTPVALGLLPTPQVSTNSSAIS